MFKTTNMSPQLRQYHQRRMYYIFLMGNHCWKCGSQDGLEFDHIDPSTKVETISIMLANSYPLELLHLELKKCQLLCAKCHLVKTREVDGLKADHGKYSMYRHHGCRCDLCKQANRQQHKEWRDKRRLN